MAKHPTRNYQVTQNITVLKVMYLEGNRVVGTDNNDNLLISMHF